MKVVDLNSSNRQHADAQKQQRSEREPTGHETSRSESLEHETLGKINALKEICQQAENIILHMDGLHGVGRKYSSQEELVARAANEVYLVLDLGHVLRLYFGDDYFDVILSSKIVQQRKPDINNWVKQIQEG